ncbi:hypothetical protein VN12_25535 [Pirellula sp. SH-Sr6A]|nr:hypothetical protein VN12_25535 [Pirellula sp. SH-Sr6A]
MLNSLLRDLLQGNTPPDLEQRILLKLRAKQMGLVEPPPASRRRPIYSDDVLDEALGAAQADVEFVSDGQFKTVLQARRRGSLAQEPDMLRVHPRPWEYRWVRRSAALLTLAASCAGIWLGYEALLSSRTTENDVVSLDTPQLPSMTKQDETNQEGEGDRSSPVETNNAIVAAPPARSEQVPPIESSRENEDRFKWVVTLPQPSAIPSPALTKIVDAQLDQVWKRVGVEVRKEPIGESWMHRVSLAAVGRMPTAAEREAFRADKGVDRTERFVNRLIESEEFTIHWSRMLAEHYLGTELHSLKSQPAALQQFVDWIQEGLAKDRRIQQLESTLALERNQVAESWSDYWWNDIMMRESAIAGDMEKNSKIKRRFSSLDAPIVGVAASLLHRSGNTLVACTQCHAANDRALSNWGNDSMVKSDLFWSFPAELTKVSARRKPSAARNASNENDTFFYEDPAGKMVMAEPGLPIDDVDSSKRIKIADWLEQSRDARAGLVELVWSKIFHQPLVPAFGLTESEASEERTDLRSLLCSQLQANGSVRDLVASLLLTDAMRTPEAKPTASWYLQASDELLTEYHRRSRLFAFVPSVALTTSQSARHTASEVAKWVVPNNGRSDGSLLAQADVNKSNGIGSSKPLSMQMSDEQLLYLLSVAKPYAKLEEFVERVAKPGLEWNDQVNHLYLLMDGRFPNRIERTDASRFYEFTGGDAKQALRLLAISRHGSY